MLAPVKHAVKGYVNRPSNFDLRLYRTKYKISFTIYSEKHTSNKYSENIIERSILTAIY